MARPRVIPDPRCYLCDHNDADAQTASGVPICHPCAEYHAIELPGQNPLLGSPWFPR